MPKTKMGKISVGSFVTSIVTLTLSMMVPQFLAGNEWMRTAVVEQESLFILLFGLLSWVGIIAILVGFVLGLIVLFRKKDHSVLLIITTLLALLFTALFLAFAIGTALYGA